METWEVVLILVLITIAISVIAKHEVPLGFVEVLDDTMFQMAILGATLAVAVISPPVAIVAIATIVIVYYIRNLVKIQMATAAEDERATNEMVEATTPRLEIQETTRVALSETVTTTSVHDTPVSAQDLPAVNKPHQADNKDVVETALKEHESRQPPEGQKMIGERSNSSGGPPMESNPPPQHENMPNPRGKEGFSDEVESFDTQASFHSSAPSPGKDSKVIEPNAELEIFSGAPSTLDSYNEISAHPANRSFVDNAGQFNIGETRPRMSPEKYEIANYMPNGDMGRNQFEPVGISIDDKISNLKKGLMPSSAPPPNFDIAVPPKAALY